MRAGVSDAFAPPQDATAQTSVPLAGLRILLVEDNLINQELATALLEQVGIHATLAENGRQALEILEHASFDGVLMDCQMPELDGYEATRAIRRGPRCRSSR